MIKLVLCGETGSMGEALKKELEHHQQYELLGFVSPRKGKLGEEFEPQLIIDFSRKDNLDFLLDYARDKKARLMICTTGFSEEQMEKMESYAKEIPLLFSTNTSYMVAVMRKVLRLAAPLLEESDLEILECHHNDKPDAPSGTAKTLRRDLRKVTKRVDIPIHSMRMGTVISDHQVVFAGVDEVLSINHTAQSNRVFAAGALKLGEKLMEKGPGFYETMDIME